MARLPQVPEGWPYGKGQTCTMYGLTCYAYAKRSFDKCARCKYYPDYGVAKTIGYLCCSCMQETLSECCKCRDSLYRWASEAKSRKEALLLEDSDLLPHIRDPPLPDVARPPVDQRPCLACTDLPTPVPVPYEVRGTSPQIHRGPTTSEWPPTAQGTWPAPMLPTSIAGKGPNKYEGMRRPGLGNSSSSCAAPWAAEPETAHTLGPLACPWGSGTSTAPTLPPVTVSPGTASVPVQGNVFGVLGQVEATLRQSSQDADQAPWQTGQLNNSFGTAAQANSRVHPDVGHIQETAGPRVRDASDERENKFADVLMCLQRIELQLQRVEVGIARLGLPQNGQHCLPRGIHEC
jgi:hypothetical protein